MISTKLSALIGSILLLAAAMPMTSAHLESGGSLTSGLFTADSGFDVCRWEGNPNKLGTPDVVDYGVSLVDYLAPPVLAPAPTLGAGCVGSDGVSGSYVTSPVNWFVTGGDVFPLTVVDNGHGQGDITLFPAGYGSLGFALCDLEVLGNGQAPDTLDETEVDSSSGGSLPDGTWDDGGLGGACHTDSYGYTPYNTLGCGTGGTHAVAEDLVSRGQVWIGASCDEFTDTDSSPGLTTCIINHAIQGGTPGDFVDCVNTFLGGNTGGSQRICGPDHVSDAINYGAGGGSVSSKGLPQNYGVPYPALSGDCAGGQGSAAVFVFNYVSLGGNPCHSGCLPNVVPATAGWVDSRNLLDTQWVIRSDQDVVANNLGPGLSVPLPP